MRLQSALLRCFSSQVSMPVVRGNKMRPKPNMCFGDYGLRRVRWAMK